MPDSGSPTFYYDFNSPYAYLAAERLDEFVPGAEWRPIAFAILLNQLGELDKRLTNLKTGADRRGGHRAGDGPRAAVLRAAGHVAGSELVAHAAARRARRG